MYTTPTSGYAAHQYGVTAMDQLFTLYNTQTPTPAAVTTTNGTLTWQYVASGLPGSSGGPAWLPAVRTAGTTTSSSTATAAALWRRWSPVPSRAPGAADCRFGRPRGLRLAKAEIGAATSLSLGHGNKMG